MKAPGVARRRRWRPLLLGISLLIGSSLRAQTPAPTGGSPWVLVPQFFARGARTEGPFQLTYVNPEHDPSRHLPFGQ